MAVDRLLKLLIDDARKTPAQLAELLGLPEDAVRRKIDEYEKSGTILYYRTIINEEKLTTPVCSALIEVKVQPERGVGFETVADRIAQFPEVKDVYLLSGDYDLQVLVEGKSMQEVAAFVAQKLSTLERVNGTRTHFVLKKYKIDGALLSARPGDQRLAVTP